MRILRQLTIGLIIICTGSSAYALSDEQILLTLPPSLEDPQRINSVPEYVVIQPSEQATFSSETSASVANLNVKEGSQFHKGDVLLKLDCRVQDADLKKAIAQQNAAKMAFESAHKLMGFQSISKLEFEQARSQKDQADADVDKLSAVVEKCTIVAPFNGAVAKLMTHLHETVKPGDPLIKIVSTDNLDFVLQVPSNWLEWLHVGTAISVHVNEVNKSIPVTVVKINPEIDSVSQTVKIFAKQNNPDPMLLPGMSGQATFPGHPLPRKETTKQN